MRSSRLVIAPVRVVLKSGQVSWTPQLLSPLPRRPQSSLTPSEVLGVREGGTNAFVLAKDKRGDRNSERVLKPTTNTSTNISIIQAYTHGTHDRNTPPIAMYGGKGNK